MTERTLRILVGLLVITAAAWGVASLLPDGEGPAPASGEIAAFFDGLDRVSTERVRMSSTSGEYELVPGPGVAGWLVNGMAADSGNVARFWSVIEGAEIGDLAAANPANHERMEVSDDTAWRLEFEKGGETRTLLVGAQGARFATSYVRVPGADEVYVLEGDLRVHMRRQLDNWRNKRLLTVDTTLVVRVEIERDSEPYAIVRGDSTWTFEDGGELDRSNLGQLMIDLNRVDAPGFLEAGDSLAMMEQAASMRALGPDGEVLGAVTLGAGEGERWLRVAGDEVIYRLQQFRVDRMFPSRERLAADAEEGS